MTTDEICELYAPKKVGITLKVLVDDEEDALPMVLVEGGPDALRLLAELLIAVAQQTENDGFFISPSGAGNEHFSEKSELGIYIHRIDD